MNELPSELLASLPKETASVAVLWWESLSDSDRHQVGKLWDERLEASFFAPQKDETGHRDRWDQLPKVEGGHFVPHDDARRLCDWGPGYFEYLLQHSDLFILDPPFRKFHIGCTRHAAARACLAAGRVPADFICPGSDPDCPLQPLRGLSLTNAKQNS